MFKKILIANRGEIAVRVIRSAKAMGIKTVAVYSEADKDSLHVELADEAVHIGPEAASESYLVIEKIIEACQQTGAEAVHPGYGFLSERPAFSHALKEAGITFIGPNPQAIEAMGDKITSKKFAAEAGVSTVPGYMGLIETPEEAVRISQDIGFPVMIKASAGGGGKGMRIAWTAEEAADGFSRARSEAASSFGDDRIFIEKFIENPRHIEIQVLGDKHGNVIYLGERECSIQRRNQKVIEEAPSPLLDEETRRKMGEQAVALAQAVDYDSAGTVEFVAGQDKSFFFLEMNTRLQVEHPVTELVTGVDLVEQMIRVAAGEQLQLAQKDVALKGWAVESRIYAEDPFRNFLPSIGRLTRYRPPQEGTYGAVTIRNDTGVVEGSEISMFYDPMIAKLVTHAPTREIAIDAMSKALDEFLVDGIQHNVPFLAALMKHDRWRSGALSTSFINDEFPEGFAPVKPDEAAQAVMASVALSMHLIERERLDHLPGRLRPHSGITRPHWVVRIDKELIPVELANGMPTTPIDMDIRVGEVTELVAVRSDWVPGDLVWRGTYADETISVQVRRILNGYRLDWSGYSCEVVVLPPRLAELDKLMPEKLQPDTSKMLLCPMPGLVVSIDVVAGQEVKVGEQLAVVEAMKMENVLRAERDCVVSAIKAAPGDSLAVDAVIMEFE
ncbi:acetyl-CoA carboxylase biotin carboxylase subunit [Pseudovibrio exalbescens]|uniref:propionyl-CoA carboxylase n=1 Tax=Pseudovibrio exalbescens TaxID=197461 RepID=A0A1U7JDQ1_9HYPH|nr:acetyl/propionyl/methylcrotonyl-CoA carboxylase subunit alpha [Pseudovibrio exalbescens]OKL42869.1 acetyl/propionyl-CoA carboxylase subuit alpha [Pseudovibrio exalbescens]